MNKVILSGNLGKDPRPFQLSNGGTKASFQLAVDRAYRDKQGNLQKRTEWPTVVLYGKNAQAALDYLKQGRRVEIEGRLQTRSYDKNGQRHYVTEGVADRMNFVPGGNGNGKASDTPEDKTQPHEAEFVPDEEF